MTSLGALLGTAAKPADDRVGLRLAGEEILLFEDYSVHCSILQQPAAFATRLSGRNGAAPLIKKYPPGTPFTLYVGPVPQFTGYVDGVDASGTTGSTSVTFRGRDTMAVLFDNDVDGERTLTNVSYGSLVRKAMEEVGLVGRALHLDNSKNRQITSGVKVTAISEPKVATEVIQSGTGPLVKHIVHAQIGESWLDFIKRHIAKAGLFLWADYNGDLILGTPNPDQRATFYWTRERGRFPNQVNVTDAQLRNDTTRRFSEVVVYARAGGKKSGRKHMHAGFIDKEMSAPPPKGFGIERQRVYRDTNVFTLAQAEAYARRKIAEVNRASWNLTYTFAGHTAPTKNGGRAVIRPDLIAHVKDDELGIDENLYIESVEYKSPPRQTIVTMMRTKDLVFGEDP